MTTNDHNTNQPALYHKVAAKIERLIQQETYRAGERLPSIRTLSRQLRVGINTVAEAYRWLEDAHIVEAKPQSGYFVSRRRKVLRPSLAEDRVRLTANVVRWNDSQLQVMQNVADPRLAPLGRGAPGSEMLPAEKLSRMLAAQSRYFSSDCVSYAASMGVERLRKQIAKRSLDSGCSLAPEQIIITSGCVEAVTLALHAICRAGDTVAVESPVYYTFLNSLQWMGLKVLEIPASPEDGMNIDLLRYAVERGIVQTCLLISNFNNPLGSLMSEENKRDLVRVLAEHDVPLIEDDVYGELGFGRMRPPAYQAFDEKGLVLYCSSFSKTLAPGYRVGWIAPGRFQEKVLALKSLFNLSTATPTQLAIAEFLARGGYDRHLRSVRRVYRDHMSHMQDCVARCFPKETRTTHPEGGYFLWVEMPPDVDALRLYEESLRAGISIAPGTLFTLSDRFTNCLRLNCSLWSDAVEKAVETVGRLASKLQADA